jgi:hypothetical protein
MDRILAPSGNQPSVQTGGGAYGGPVPGEAIGLAKPHVRPFVTFHLTV